MSMEIGRAYPGLQIVLEDTPQNARDALQVHNPSEYSGYVICAYLYFLKFWTKRLPEAVEKNRVQFVGSSFFEPQPKFHKSPDVFLLRYVLHDWSDKYAIKILRHLRDTATADTKLVVIDTIVAHACEADDSAANPFVSPPPRPLLRNWGEANMTVYNVDIAVRSSVPSFIRLPC